MTRTIKIPLLGVETCVSTDATETEIIDAVSEAAVAFCIAAQRHGQGIEKELELVETAL